VVHIRIGDDRRQFYPYGVSIIEPARSPAHQLRMMEDAMVVYRLTRAPERRVFYVDVGGLPSHKAEAFIDRMKDQFRKKKMAAARGQGNNASMVEERWHAPAADEDYWLPIRPNSNTRIETLPGAQNLGEIDDTVYFRNKLFVALNFPRNYYSNEDPQATRITLSAQDVKFARFIERLQSNIEDGLWEIADRHLTLRGFPTECYDDLRLRMTPPSDWREMSRAEVVGNRINYANSLKQAQLLSDFDVLTKWMKYDEEEAKQIIARMKIQKLEDLKLQIIAQNPTLLGVGVPGQGEQEVGTQPGGPSPMLGGDAGGGPPGMGGPPPGGPGGPPPGMPPAPPPPQGEQQ
ncbi:MAG: portal protein, partial [Minisyncoccia bacterium]